MFFKPSRYYLIAFVIVVIWGTTFLSTKVLINNGLSSEAIFCIVLCWHILVFGLKEVGVDAYIQYITQFYCRM